MTDARQSWDAPQSPEDYPWRVAIRVPGRGLEDAGDQLDAWCREQLPSEAWCWPIREGRYSRESGVLWTVWGFKLPVPAALFAAVARRLLPAITVDLHDARASATPPWGLAPEPGQPTPGSRANHLAMRWVVTVEQGLPYYRILVPELRVWCDHLAPGAWRLEDIWLLDRWVFARRDHAESFQAYLAKRWKREVSRLEETPAQDQGGTI